MNVAAVILWVLAIAAFVVYVVKLAAEAQKKWPPEDGETQDVVHFTGTVGAFAGIILAMILAYALHADLGLGHASIRGTFLYPTVEAPQANSNGDLVLLRSISSALVWVAFFSALTLVVDFLFNGWNLKSSTSKFSWRFILLISGGVGFVGSIASIVSLYLQITG